MSGERAATTRMRRAGRICSFCNCPLPRPHTIGEQLCAACQARSPRRRVYMYFMLRERWHCQFMEEDLKTPMARRLVLRDPAKLLEIAERGGYAVSLEGRQAMDQAIANGRGGIWLQLTEEQYRKLRGS